MQAACVVAACAVPATFTLVRRQEPDDAWVKRMAEGVAFLARMKRKAEIRYSPLIGLHRTGLPAQEGVPPARFRPLQLFGRRPRACGATEMGPASEKAKQE
jgi:hypothetical protein